jgi:hypothetical protein
MERPDYHAPLDDGTEVIYIDLLHIETFVEHYIDARCLTVEQRFYIRMGQDHPSVAQVNEHTKELIQYGITDSA